MMDKRTLPEYLKDDASFLQCGECGRKSWGDTPVNSVCGMPQPSGQRCPGIMRGRERHHGMPSAERMLEASRAYHAAEEAKHEK
jgi:hypothetical protein